MVDQKIYTFILKQTFLETMKNIIITFLGVLLFGFANAQECDRNGAWDGDELNVDCGGAVCPTCLPLWYEMVDCDESAGKFEIEISLPTYLWDEDFMLSNGVYYSFSGDFNVDCGALFECQQQTYELTDASNALIEVNMLKAATQEIVGYGRGTLFAACVKLDNIESNCPDNSEFATTATSVWADSSSYMVKLEMENGLAPYRIVDNSVNRFYQFQWDEDVYYLGAIPDSVELDVSVFDFNGCEVRFTELAKPTGEDPLAAIQNLPLLGQLDIFPTLFSTQLNLNIEEQTEGTLTAFDLSGQALASWEAQEINGKSLQVSHLPVGTYVFALETPTGIYTRIAIKEQ